eukprot:gene19112-22890_t
MNMSDAEAASMAPASKGNVAQQFGELYRWHQSNNTVIISFVAPQDVTKSEIVSDINGTAIRAGVRDYPPNVEGSFHAPIKSSKWTLKEGSLVQIHLDKATPGKWPHLLSSVIDHDHLSRACVLFDYAPTAEEELELFAHELVSITAKDESGWWEGVKLGQTGVFPSNFVVEFPLDYQSPEAPQPQPPVQQHKAEPPAQQQQQYNHQPAQQQQPQQQQPAQQAKEGRITSLFKKPLKKITAFSSLLHSSHGSDEKKGSSGSSSGAISSGGLPKARVLYDFETSEPGELPLRAGETIIVTSKDTSGWWQGTNSTGQAGWFSNTFVEEIKADQQQQPSPVKPKNTPPPPPPTSSQPQTVEAKLQAIKPETPKLEHVRKPGAARGRKPPSRARASYLLPPEEREEREKMRANFHSQMAPLRNEDFEDDPEPESPPQQQISSEEETSPAQEHVVEAEPVVVVAPTPAPTPTPAPVVVVETPVVVEDSPPPALGPVETSATTTTPRIARPPAPRRTPISASAGSVPNTQAPPPASLSGSLGSSSSTVMPAPSNDSPPPLGDVVAEPPKPKPVVFKPKPSAPIRVAAPVESTDAAVTDADVPPKLGPKIPSLSEEDLGKITKPQLKSVPKPVAVATEPSALSSSSDEIILDQAPKPIEQPKPVMIKKSPAPKLAPRPQQPVESEEQHNNEEDRVAVPKLKPVTPKLAPRQQPVGGDGNEEQQPIKTPTQSPPNETRSSPSIDTSKPELIKVLRPVARPKPEGEQQQQETKPVQAGPTASSGSAVPPTARPKLAARPNPNPSPATTAAPAPTHNRSASANASPPSVSPISSSPPKSSVLSGAPPPAAVVAAPTPVSAPAPKTTSSFSPSVYSQICGELFGICMAVGAVPMASSPFIHVCPPAPSSLVSVSALSLSGSGKPYSIGSDDDRVTPLFQAIWPLIHCLLVDELGAEEVSKYIGDAPMESKNDKPYNAQKRAHNPFCTSGALVTAHLLSQKYPNIAHRISHSEGADEVATAHLLKSAGLIKQPDDVLDFFYQINSIQLTSSQMAQMAQWLGTRSTSDDVTSCNMLETLKKCDSLTRRLTSQNKEIIAIQGDSGALMLVVPGVIALALCTQACSDDSGTNDRHLEFCNLIIQKLTKL